MWYIAWGISCDNPALPWSGHPQAWVLPGSSIKSVLWTRWPCMTCIKVTCTYDLNLTKNYTNVKKLCIYTHAYILNFMCTHMHMCYSLISVFFFSFAELLWINSTQSLCVGFSKISTNASCDTESPGSGHEAQIPCCNWNCYLLERQQEPAREIKHYFCDGQIWPKSTDLANTISSHAVTS